MCRRWVFFHYLLLTTTTWYNIIPIIMYLPTTRTTWNNNIPFFVQLIHTFITLSISRLPDWIYIYIQHEMMKWSWWFQMKTKNKKIFMDCLDIGMAGRTLGNNEGLPWPFEDVSVCFLGCAFFCPQRLVHAAIVRSK